MSLSPFLHSPPETLCHLLPSLIVSFKFIKREEKKNLAREKKNLLFHKAKRWFLRVDTLDQCRRMENF
jgi:hypothetical protein